MGATTAAVAVLFDIDGTLISSGGAGAASWRMAFDDLYGIAADIGEFSDAGMTDPEVARLTFVSVVGHEPSPAELARLMAVRLGHLPRAVAESEGYRVLDGVRETLARLGEQGCLLGLNTGGVEAAAHIKLERADLNRHFSFGGYGSDSPDRAQLTRRAVERAGAIFGTPLGRGQALVVGDTPMDIDAAHAAGAVAVGVASGHFSAEQLRDAGADHVLASLEEELPL
ncbi:MAG: HAD hydrolase-like protein [Thermoleophilaceae bacterium]|nr:HAD hydrolase-like protein [Thermoleophilaceae bacterium]